MLRDGAKTWAGRRTVRFNQIDSLLVLGRMRAIAVSKCRGILAWRECDLPLAQRAQTRTVDRMRK
jgi:hypothetical protein